MHIVAWMENAILLIMKKINIIFILSLVVIVMPTLGLPHAIETFIMVVAGLGVAFFSFPAINTLPFFSNYDENTKEREENYQHTTSSGGISSFIKKIKSKDKSVKNFQRESEEKITFSSIEDELEAEPESEDEEEMYIFASKSRSFEKENEE